MGHAGVEMKIIYLSILVITTILIIFGFKSLTELKIANENVEILNFIENLKLSLGIQTARSFGSVEEKIFTVPKSVKAVCFIDKSREFKPFFNKRLTSETKRYKEFNLFFEPFDKFQPYLINEFKLDKEENPLCVKVRDGKLKLLFRSEGNKTLISAVKDKEKKIDCVPIIHNIAPERGIDIVFLGYNYRRVEDFDEDIKEYIKLFNETEPFKFDITKFNFYKINKFDINCRFASWIRCNEFDIKRLAANCPNDYIIILAKRNAWIDFIIPVRSSAIGNIAKINTADKKIVILHEFGHIFGGLADEYVDESFYSKENFNVDIYPNCDRKFCNKWTSITDGCYKGCSLTIYYRPTRNSIMRSLTTNDYGPVNSKELIKRLKNYG